MTKIFLIHGAFGNPTENWFPWLKQKLENFNHEVIMPQFPTPENQSLENWKKVFSEYKNKIDEDTIFIGHSLAPAFLLSVLEQINLKIKGVFFISGFLKSLGNETFDSINKIGMYQFVIKQLFIFCAKRVQKLQQRRNEPFFIFCLIVLNLL